jgi:hypothetical protein
MFDAAQKCHVSLLLKNIRLPLAPFTLEVDVEICGRVTAIHGPSGAGETTLLDVIAGLRRPESALIQLNDVVLTDTSTKTFVPPRHRGIGYVPQDPESNEDVAFRWPPANDLVGATPKAVGLNGQCNQFVVSRFVLNSGFTVQVFVPVDVRTMLLLTAMLRILKVGRGWRLNGDDLATHRAVMHDAIVEVVGVVPLAPCRSSCQG